jgi:hypothetical protein
MKRKEGAFVVAQAAIFVGVIALVALPAQSANQMQAATTSTSSGGQPAVLSGVSPQGLQLRVMLNSSSVQSHGVVLASVEVFNTLDRNVSFSGVSENQNISEWSYDDYFCPASFLLGFAIFQGHFAAGNISSAGPALKIVPESVVFCALSPISGAVTFLPVGDRAVVRSDTGSYQATLQLNATTKYINCKGFSGGGGECDLGAGPGLVGYWNYSVPAAADMNFTSPGFVYFPPGEYTIAAADDWNQYVYATFVVQPPGASSTTSTAAADPTDGFPRNAAGGWDMGYVGSDPNPTGCDYSLGSTFGDGYSLSIYSEYDAVKAGGLVCISIVLMNVSGTTVTYGNSSEVETGFNVTDSSGRIVLQDSCIPDDQPPNPQGHENAARKIFECGAIWDTSVASAAGVVPTPGSYTITAFASYPGTTNQPPVLAVTRESVNFSVLPAAAG